MSHQPVQREAVEAEWRVFEDWLKTILNGIKAKRESLLYQQNISKALIFSNALNQAWKQIIR